MVAFNFLAVRGCKSAKGANNVKLLAYHLWRSTLAMARVVASVYGLRLVATEDAEASVPSPEQ